MPLLVTAMSPTIELRCPESGVHIHSFVECIQITHNKSYLIYNSHLDFKDQMSYLVPSKGPNTINARQICVYKTNITGHFTKFNKTFKIFEFISLMK